MNYRNYTDNDIIEKAKDSTSIASLLKKLGLKPAGGNYYIMKHNLQRLNIDTSHWTGQGWNKGQQLKDWSSYKKTNSVKRNLLKQRVQCDSCNLSHWLGVAIPLECHHVDGDRTNNNYSNLKLLCCNCHALTANWRGRNIKA